jgi:hypothetical protein
LRSFKKCLWNGLKNDLKEHVKAAHWKYFLEGSTFTFDRLFGFGAILSCYSELFTYYQEIKDGRLYCAVQLIGTSSEASKYIYKCTLRAANGIEKISKTLFVRVYSEDWETIFNSGICLVLDEKSSKTLSWRKWPRIYRNTVKSVMKYLANYIRLSQRWCEKYCFLGQIWFFSLSLLFYITISIIESWQERGEGGNYFGRMRGGQQNSSSASIECKILRNQNQKFLFLA